MVFWPNVIGTTAFTQRSLNALWDTNNGPFFLTLKKEGNVPDHVVSLYLDKYGYKLKIDHKEGVAKRPFYSG